MREIQYYQSNEVKEIQLPDTFTLLMFSDGVLEILPDSELMAKEQTLLQLLEHCPSSIEELAQCLGIDQAVLCHGGPCCGSARADRLCGSGSADAR